MENVCIVCGDIIPEGRWICPNCEAGYEGGVKQYRKMDENNPEKCENCKWFGEIEDKTFVHWCFYPDAQGATAKLWSCNKWEKE